MSSYHVRVDGKFLEAEGRRFLVKGATYGTFAPDARGVQFPVRDRVDSDFAQMAAAGLNTVRLYTVPPAWLLDRAERHGLRAIVGVPWPQHIAFLDDAPLTRQIRRDAVQTVRELGDHPAVLMFAIGNEVPAPVVRWHGEARVEAFLAELYDAVKAVSPDSLFTYVNYPTTEHLDLDCFDVCAFNVYLHREADLRAYLGRLQHIAGTKPLLLAEAGADSVREGLNGQAELTATHIRAAFVEGACGAVAFAWTDEWWRGGQVVDDWCFGLVDAERRPKPALAAVETAFRDAPFAPDVQRRWPLVSVVVCAYNAADTLDDCLRSLATLTYPSVEVIVVNDGSRDTTGEIAKRYVGRVCGLTVVDIPNGGLSAARNVGLARARGEIVAYTDADVRVDPDWLTHLVQPIVEHGFAGSGGPNVVPPDDPFVAQAVARAPGGPTHVLLDDRVAEHVPGCNMAFRRDALLSIGGFNPVYLRAGDDVDICWRLQSRGYKVGFAASALVWHHHRATVKAYWRQQVGYGEGEAWLAAHHPDKFVNGQALWHGRIYSPLPFVRSLASRSVNTGVWGTAAFPSVYTTDTHFVEFLPHSPVWMVTSTVLLGVAAIGAVLGLDSVSWAAWMLGTAGWAITVSRCLRFAMHTNLSGLPPLQGRSERQRRWAYRVLIAFLHLLQPIARLVGRFRGLASSPQVVAPEHVTRVPWNMPVPAWHDMEAAGRLLAGRPMGRTYWSESWVSHTSMLSELVGVLRASRPTQIVDVGDGWESNRDLSLTIGRWGWLHVRTLVEEHAQGRCLLRVAARLRPSFAGLVQAAVSIALVVGVESAVFTFSLHRPSVMVLYGLAGAVLAVRAAWHAARAVAVLDRALQRVTADAGMVRIDGRSGHAPAWAAQPPTELPATPRA